MTIKDLSQLTPIEAHWLNSKPLDNGFLTAVQATDFYKEARNIKPDWWRFQENKLALQLKFNANSPVTFKQEAIEKYTQETVDNAYRHMTYLLKRGNVPLPLHYAAISWFINEIIDIEETKKQNNWEWEIKK
jgi:hypothetical protein